MDWGVGRAGAKGSAAGGREVGGERVGYFRAAVEGRFEADFAALEVEEPILNELGGLSGVEVDVGVMMVKFSADDGTWAWQPCLRG